MDQFSQNSFLTNNIGVRPHIRRRRHCCDDVADKVKTADFRRYILFLQTVLKRDQIDRLALIKKLYHRLKHDTVLRLIKIRSRHDLRGSNDRLPVHQHGADHRLLCLNAVRSHPFHQRFIHTFVSPVFLFAPKHLCRQDPRAPRT